MKSVFFALGTVLSLQVHAADLTCVGTKPGYNLGSQVVVSFEDAELEELGDIRVVGKVILRKETLSLNENALNINPGPGKQFYGNFDPNGINFTLSSSGTVLALYRTIDENGEFGDHMMNLHCE